MRAKVLHQRDFFWDVGQGSPEHRPGTHYPHDYAGRAISVIPAWCEYSPADTADQRRRVIELDLSDADVKGLRNRRFKIVQTALADVTFDDSWGAVAAQLREKHADPEAFEREEAAAVEAAEVANRAEEKRYELEVIAHRIARDEYAKALVSFEPALGAEPPVPPEPPTFPLFIERRDAFLEEASALAQSLPKTIAHTGAGLYKVQAAGTMPTPAHLWEMEEVDPPDEGDPGGNPGTGSNVTVVPGEIGSALDFNGNNSNVNLGDVVELNAVQKFTIAFRMHPDMIDITEYLFVKQLDASNFIRINTSAAGNMVFNIYKAGLIRGFFDYSTVISAGSWHHVAMVFDGSGVANADRLKVYVDGYPVTLTTFDGTIPATTPDLSGQDATIGSAATSFGGSIDDSRIIADALTDAQVKVLAGRGLAHWDTIAAAVKDNGTSTITLTTGTSEDRTGEVFVSGGNGYAVSAKIDDTHITVIGDASGESGTCSISPYTTIQSALDQLWADQGAGAFTATQEIRVYDGTYNEQVSFNSFVPRSRHKLLLRAASGNSPVLSCTGVDYALYSAGGVSGIVIDGLIISGVPNVNFPINLSTSHDLQFKNCTISCGASGHTQINTQSAGMYFENCELDGSAGLATLTTHFSRRMSFFGCKIHDYPMLFRGGISNRRLEGCTVWDCGYLLTGYGHYYHGPLVLLNCTFYDLTGLVREYTYTNVGRDWIIMKNNIFHTVGTMWWEGADHQKFDQGRADIDSNCYYNVTKWYDSVAESHITIFADWQARGYDASGFEADPLLTAPGAGDFSLQAASPCRHAGHGSGVVTGQNDIAFDAHHPDIGSWSSGILSVAAPSIMQVTDLGTNASARLVLTADNAQDVISVRYRLDADDQWTLFGSTRTGSGTLDITGLTLAEYRFIATAVRGDETSLPSNSMKFTLTDGTRIDVETALYSILNGNATLTALVASRIYPQEAPQGVASPYLTYSHVDSHHYHNMKGASGLVETRMQIAAWAQPRNAARPYDEVKDVMEAVRLALDGYKGPVTVGGGTIDLQAVVFTSESDGSIPPVGGGERGWQWMTVDYVVVHDESVPTF